MSWLPRSLLPDQNDTVHSPKPDDVDDDARGVKEDLSELTETLRSQFWGVASFLAPPPPDKAEDGDGEGDDSRSNCDQDEEDGDRDSRSNGDQEEEEIEGAHGNGKPEDSRSNCYQEDEEEEIEGDHGNGEAGDSRSNSDEDEVVGVTEEALAFANNIGHHPETWLDFPLEEEDEEGFEGT